MSYYISTVFEEISITENREIEILTTKNNSILEHENNYFCVVAFKGGYQMFYWSDENERWKPCDGIKVDIVNDELIEVIDEVEDKIIYDKISYTLGGRYWFTEKSKEIKRKLKVDYGRANILNIFIQEKSNPKEINLYAGYSISSNFKNGKRNHAMDKAFYNNKGKLLIPINKKIKNNSLNKLFYSKFY